MDMITIFAVVMILVLAGTFWYIRKRRNKTPNDLLQRPDFIYEVINTTIDDRNHYEVVFDVSDSGLDKRFSGSCIACNRSTLLVDTNIPYQVPSWTGQPVRAFFSSGRGMKSTMYECLTRIERVTPYRSGFALELAMPSRLMTNQRRAFVRFAPPTMLVANISVWSQSVDAERLSPASLPHPTVNMPEVYLKNISAGGAGLGLVLHAPLGALAKSGDPLLIRFELRDGEGRTALALWVCAVIVTNKEAPKHHALALRFTRWVIEGEPGQELSWFPANADMGIPPLAAWVMRRHLEIHRTNVV